MTPSNENTGTALTTSAFDPQSREQQQNKNLLTEIFVPIAARLGVSRLTAAVPVSDLLRAKLFTNNGERLRSLDAGHADVLLLAAKLTAFFLLRD